MGDRGGYGAIRHWGGFRGCFRAIERYRVLWELGGRGTVGGYLGSYTVVREDHKGICMGYQSVTGDMGV